MKVLPFFLLSFLILYSCSKEDVSGGTGAKVDVVDDNTRITGEQKAVETFERFLTELSYGDPATRAASTPRIVKVNQTSSASYGNNKVSTRALDHAMPIYELILENADATSGFAVVTDDMNYSEVVAYAPKGSLADTVYNKSRRSISGRCPVFLPLSKRTTCRQL